MERKKVVLADNVELFLMLENTFFNREEFEMITARGGRELLRIIRATSPDMIFMDLEMPEMGGDECCRILKGDETTRHIPVVIVAPAVSTDDLDRCRVAGCDDVVTRPIDRREFLSTSRRFLQIRERGEKRFQLRMPVRFGVISAGNSVDLNSGGMFLATELVLEPGSELKLDFTLPGSETSISCTAVVAWANGPETRKKPNLPNGMGVRFMGLGPEEEAAIANCMEHGIAQMDEDQ